MWRIIFSELKLVLYSCRQNSLKKSFIVCNRIENETLNKFRYQFLNQYSIFSPPFFLPYPSKLQPAGCTTIKLHQLHQALIRWKRKKKRKLFDSWKEFQESNKNTLLFHFIAVIHHIFSVFIKKRMMTLHLDLDTFLLFLIEVEAMKRKSLD